MNKFLIASLAAALLSGASVASFGLAGPAADSTTDTPAALVATYDQLAVAILAVKKSEANLVRSILETGYGHATAALARAQAALEAGKGAAARKALEELAALVAQLGTEGDNAVAGIRKRLLEGGHHHNAEGERQGIYDPGFVVVTRAAKRQFLEASRAIGRLSRSPDRKALEREWKKVETAWKKLSGGKSK